MACKPSIDILYGHLNKKLNRRMADNAPFSLKDYMQSVNKIMTDANPEIQDVGIINAQAVPQLLGIIMMSNKAIKDYLKTQNITIGDVSDLADQFADIKTGLEEVKTYISAELITPDSIKKAIKALNKSNYDIPLADPSNLMMFSKGRMRPISIAGTTGQGAIRINPENATPDELNKLDKEKIVPGTVIKSIVNEARKKDRDDVTIKYQGIDVYLRPILSDKVYEQYFTSEDKKYHESKGGRDSIAAFLTDAFGNLLFFDNSGNITTQDKGVPVYQYLRKVTKENNKLKYAGELVAAQDIVNQKILEGEVNGIKYTEAKKKEMLKETEALQLKEVNQLYSLRKTILENPDKVYTLPIIGGSFGIINVQYVPLTDTDITEDEISGLTIIDDENSGRNGYATFQLSRPDDKAVSIDNTVYIQRGNVDEELAGKIADILTTKAKLNGRELDALERHNYAKAYLSNAITDNQIKIEIDDSSGVEELVVLIKGKPVDLAYVKSSRDKIYNHLMKAVDFKGKYKQITYPARVSISNDNLGKPFTDYTIEGDTIKSEVINYFNSIKKYTLIEYSKDSLPAVTALNGYLRYAMPEEILPIAKQREKSERPTADMIIDNVEFEISAYDNAKNVTEALVDSADAVISLSEEFKSTTEAAVKRLAKDLYSGLPINKRLTLNTKAVKQYIIDKLNDTNAQTVFFSGDDFSILKPKGYTQAKLDKHVLDVLTNVMESDALVNKNFTIVSNAQTGVSEAVVKAASKLGIPTRVITTSDWSFREPKAATKSSKLTFKDTKNKAKFLKRFGITIEADKDVVKVTPVKGSNKGVPKGKVDPTKDKLFDDEDFSSINDVSLFRSKSLRDNYKISEAREKEIIDWYTNDSRIGKELPLTIITDLVNSPAFAQFTRHGITLFKGDGGTALDIYHEAWHGFSQFFMTKAQKAALYNAVAKASGNAKWSKISDLNKEQIYFEIEEALAEGFRDYKAGKYVPKTKEEKNLFKRILNFLLNLFRGASARDTEFHVADLAAIRELYDKLTLPSKSKESIEFFDTYTPSMDNVMFFKLNRSKTIQPVDQEDEAYTTFTIDESTVLKNSIDSMIATSMKNFVQSHDTNSGAIEELNDKSKRVKIYEGIQNAWVRRIEQLEERLSKIQERNATLDNPNLFLEQQVTGQIDLLSRAVNEFGDINEAINNKKYTKGVVSYHIRNSRFPIFKESDVELEEPSIAGSTVFKDNSGENSTSARDMLNRNTEMILSSVFKTEVDSEGNRKMVPNELGYFELEDPGIVWSRLARTLEGSMTPADMYNKLITYSESYPEFNQVLDLLPATRADISYSDTLLETQFWQDLKKPRIQYTELNLNPVEDSKDGEGVTKFSSSVMNASTDVSAVMREWSNNFINDTTTSNAFIYLAKGRNMLDLKNVLKTFGPNGVLNKERALEFLAAIGVTLDQNSAEIKAILSKDYFIQTYGIDRMYNLMKKIESFSGSKDKTILTAIEEFKSDPVKIFREGFKEDIPQFNSVDVNFRMRMLATLQNQYSDAFSNFSAFTPEMNRVFEHFLDSTATRNILALNNATNWQQATGRSEADPNGEFKHMRWLAEENNPYSAVSVILNSIFNLKSTDPGQYGKKITVDSAGEKLNEIKLQVLSGTKIFDERNRSEGVSTSSADTTTKYLQEMNTMLLKGIQEFMRHASKSLSLGLQAGEIVTAYPRQNKNLYVDVQDFRPSTLGRGDQRAFDIILGYISGEHDRINRFNANRNKYSKWTGYSRKIKTKDGKTVMAAEVFTAFDDVLTEATKNKLYAIKENLLDYFAKPENAKLKEEVFTDVKNYFNDQTDQNLARLQEARFVDDALYEMASAPNMSQTEVDRVISKAYTYNAWIHNFETTIIGYGDLVQYNHAKEEFHKRNAGWGGSGNGFRADKKIQNFINSDKFRNYYIEANKNKGWKAANYDGTIKTAVIQDDEKDSKYYEEYKETFKKDILERIKDSKTIKDKEAYAEKAATIEAKDYLGMNIGDGQGYISLESYRKFKYLEGAWGNEQENLYRKVAAGQQIGIDEVIKFFPSYKLQYFGAVETEGLGLMSFNKFSLTPLIPSVVKGSNLEKLHDKMMDDQMDYVLFESGEKVGHITSDGESDKFVNKDGTVNTDITLTPNILFAENLKNVTNVNDEYKEVSVFSTQLRKLILEGLFERGVIQTTDPSGITNKKVLDYINRVEEYSEILKLELLNEIGYEQVGDEYIPTDKVSTEKIAELIRANLDRDDSVGDHLIEFIDTNADGTLKYDLSFHPESNKIEKLILSVINKRLIRQKVKGEPLVQVSSSMYDGVFKQTQPKFNKASDADVKKYAGTNFLPTYHKKADGTTAAMKVMIALQGDFKNLLKLKDKNGKEIGTIDRLNELIKDDEWLDYNNGANRKALTMVGVRIPVQGLNSMEFMEVYHFLPAEAGNLIIPPPEIVAKSGADFDIDKLTIFMPNLTGYGKVIKREYESMADLKQALMEAKALGEDTSDFFERQKQAIQNDLIQDIRNILELPENYASLIRPNSTYTLKEISDDLSQYVMKYDPFRSMNGINEDGSISYMTDDKGKKLISPTRVLEAGYNLYKHESNVIGKRTLGLGAVENTFNVIFNSLGAAMPKYYLHGKETKEREMRLFLKHNTLINKDGDEVISLSDRYDVNKQYKIADLFSQAINGWVDVEKDAWIFFIQGNYEVAPILLYLLQTGVPVKEAVYFVSQPLVREYVKEQRLSKSTFAEVLGKKPNEPWLFKSDASKRVLSNYFGGNIKSGQRYAATTNATTGLFMDRTDKSFTEKEMLDLIKDSKTDPKAAESDLSRAMFLHFLEIEQQIDGIKKLKFAFNQDTNLKSTLSAVEEGEYKVETLQSLSSLDQTLRERMENESVISSFKVGSLSLAMTRPMFPLMYHKTISDYIIANMGSIEDDKNKTFGDKDRFIQTFRNDLILMLLQNALRKYNLEDSYKSYSLNTTIPRAIADNLNFGAFVKENDKGQPTLYLDTNKVKDEYAKKLFTATAKGEGSYTALGLHPLDTITFTNESEYTKFVAEREYLRSLIPVSQADITEDFEYIKSLYPTESEGKQKRRAYEKFLAERALENSFNPIQIFKNQKTAYALRLNDILRKNPALISKYDVLKKLKTDFDSKKTRFNLFVNERKYNNSISNLYYKNFKDLANPNIIKVADPEENQVISEFFSKLPLFAFYQSGLNKNKLSFVSLVDYNPFIDVIEKESQEFMKILDDPEKGRDILNAFYKVFVSQNSSKNIERYYFKNYFMTNDIKSLIKSGDSNVRFGVNQSYTNPQIYNYSVLGKFAKTAQNNTHYTKLVESNPDFVFIHNMLADETRNPNAVYSGQNGLRQKANFSVGIVTSDRRLNDNFSDTKPENYQNIKDSFEESIANIKAYMADGKTVAFSQAGYGDPTIMPEELFVYLSKRLYEEFRYVNPGSTKYQEVMDVINRVQGISDAEILATFNDENNPFKCKI
jgi:protein-tyrosine-phosphatase